MAKIVKILRDYLGFLRKKIITVATACLDLAADLQLSGNFVVDRSPVCQQIFFGELQFCSQFGPDIPPLPRITYNQIALQFSAIHNDTLYYIVITIYVLSLSLCLRYNNVFYSYYENCNLAVFQQLYINGPVCDGQFRCN